MPILFDPHTAASGRREPVDNCERSACPHWTPISMDGEPSLPLRPDILCLQKWLDLNG